MTKIKTNSSFDLLDTTGVLGSVIQSTIVKLGTVTEKIVYETLKQTGYKAALKTADNKEIQLIDFLNNIDIADKYAGQRVSFPFEGKKIQGDILVFKDKHFYVFEMKSSTNFDTKKSLAEQKSLFESTVALQRLISKSGNPILSDCLVSGVMCCFNAADKNEIVKGFKGNLKDNRSMWTNEDFSNIVAGQLTTIHRKDLILVESFSYLLKAFVESSINSHNFFEQPLIRSFGISLMTGKEFTSSFGLDFNKVLEKSKEVGQEVLESSLNEKSDSMSQKQYDYFYDFIEGARALDLEEKELKLAGIQLPRAKRRLFGSRY